MGQSNRTKYPALRMIAAWYKAVGYVVGGIILCGAVIATFKSGLSFVTAGIGIGAFVFIVMSMAFAEIIQMFLDTESSSRRSAEYLKTLVDLKLKPKYSSSKSTPSMPSPPKKSDQPVAPINKPAAAPRNTPINRPKLDASQVQSIKKLIKHLHSDGLTAHEIVRELRAESIQTLDGADVWTEKAVHDVLLAG